MKFAIVGANFLGCSTAYYLRQALNLNQVERSPSPPEDAQPDEIIVFDQLSRSGGHKFNALSLAHSSATVGTAASLDISCAPLFQSLLRDISFPLSANSLHLQWSIFDWDADAYCISKYRSRTLAALASNKFLVILLQLFALYSTWFFFTNIQFQGIHFFLGYQPDEALGKVSFVRYPYVLWFLVTLVLAGGVIPLTFLFKFQNNLIQRFVVRITAAVIYGIPTTSNIYTLVQNFREHLILIDKHNSSTSCITLGHLLSACGLAKYFKKSTSEFLGPFQISPDFLNQCVWAPMSISYADSSNSISAASNSLASMLSMLSDSPIPSSLRWKAKCMSVEDSINLCPALLKSADAKLHLNTQIMSVRKNGENQYDLYTNINDSDIKVGTFDAVLIAAVVNDKEFKSDALDSDVADIFSLKTSSTDQPDFGHPQASFGVNTARFVSLVHGNIKPSFFRLNSSKDMPNRMYVLNSINCAEVTKVSSNVWKVTSAEAVTKDSSICESLFDNVQESVTYERPSRRYSIFPLSNMHGSSAPNLILARRFVNVAAIDRVCNDVNMECIAARNAASLFRVGVASWK